MSNLDAWLPKKGLILNYEKTKYMIVKKSQCKIDFNNLTPLTVNNHVIERVSVFKCLGMVGLTQPIDEHFSFREHAEYVKKRVCVNVGMLNRHRRKLTPHMLTVLINAYVCSITDYCITTWGPARLADFASIQNMVNRLLVVYCYPKLSKFYSKSYWKGKSDCGTLDSARVECRIWHTKVNYNDLLEKFNLLSLNERLAYYTLWNLYKIKKSCNVKQISDMYNETETGHNTRGSQKYHVLTHNSKMFTSSVQYYSIKKWNELSSDTISLILHPKEKDSVNVRSILSEHVLKMRDC